LASQRPPQYYHRTVLPTSYLYWPTHPRRGLDDLLFFVWTLDWAGSHPTVSRHEQRLRSSGASQHFHKDGVTNRRDDHCRRYQRACLATCLTLLAPRTADDRVSNRRRDVLSLLRDGRGYLRVGSEKSLSLRLPRGRFYRTLWAGVNRYTFCSKRGSTSSKTDYSKLGWLSGPPCNESRTSYYLTSPPPFSSRPRLHGNPLSFTKAAPHKRFYPGQATDLGRTPRISYLDDLRLPDTLR